MDHFLLDFFMQKLSRVAQWGNALQRNGDAVSPSLGTGLSMTFGLKVSN